MFEKCPCGSGKLYLQCCKPYIKGKELAPSPEALMRSRYTAYVLHEIDYIVDTCLPNAKINRENVRDWSEKSKWLGLEIVSEQLIDTGETGEVAFKATYERRQLKYVHSEVAFFKKHENRWLYVSGKIISIPVTRSGDKVGRNDPCPCRSGKKYKHCCGNN
jgi:SEC-C motif-containing protein